VPLFHVSIFEQRHERFTPFFARRFNRALSGPEPISLTEPRNAFEFFCHGLGKGTADVLACLLCVEPDTYDPIFTLTPTDSTGSAQMTPQTPQPNSELSAQIQNCCGYRYPVSASLLTATRWEFWPSESNLH
jgi:hypothetical protein